jgi:methionyl-tRNA synthetase
MNLARIGNKYFNDSEPWKTIKSNKDRCGTTINLCLQTIFTLAELFKPVIPFTSEKIFIMLNSTPTTWENAGKENLPADHILNKPEILFPKIEDKVIEDLTANLNKTEQAQIPDETEEISIEEFKRIKLKAAKIITAERVEKSEKLLKLNIDLGFEKRQVIAGIAQSYQPEELIGKKIIVLSNLKPAKLFGLESKGMILAIESSDGKFKLLEVPDSVIPGKQVT